MSKCNNPACNASTQVFGCKYCPHCYPAYSRIDDLERHNAELRKKVAELEARLSDQTTYILKLRKAIIDATNNCVTLDSGKWVHSIDDGVLQWPKSLKGLEK